ncbi:MAG: polyamine ABC transporter ATP-binding protein [Candidatus Puniceispirillum sp.]|nr:polyamine ABC transporter ATP-binding protein [Candidatus Pelagibacter sp.]MBA4282836.1 polyamine ABC transporter ATP-binding protein [Candidatus Puniceispirillum sp.]
MTTAMISKDPWTDPNAKPYLSLDSVNVQYAYNRVLSNLSLSIYKGEFFSILGASGCGKSTLLRALAGFEPLSSGSIKIDGVDISNMPPHKRPVNMMFQSYALFPHMSVFDNIAFGLKQDKVPKNQIRERVFDMLELVQMQKLADRKPQDLSGGQKQRVALARSLVKKPKLILLDEPMAALDKNLREQTQFELVNIQEKVGITFVMVTHDQEEAMTMSTRMAIMESGRVSQIGVPHDVYEFPNSKYVAQFIGSMNIFEGIMVQQSDHYITVQTGDLENEMRVSHTNIIPVGSRVTIAIRPEKIKLSLYKEEDQKGKVHQEFNSAIGLVKEIAYLGDMSVYHIELPNAKIIQANVTNKKRFIDRDITWGDKVFLEWFPENGVALLS